MLLKPRFGSRRWSGIWPPSKPAMLTPERDLAPFWPRPAVLPRPEPMPRPTRTRDWRAPLLSLISFSFMSCTRFRFCRASVFVHSKPSGAAIRRPWRIRLNFDNLFEIDFRVGCPELVFLADRILAPEHLKAKKFSFFRR